MVEKQLFFALLHEARRLKNILGWNWLTRRGYLLGMMRMFWLHQEDIRIAENLKDFWKCQRSGSE